MKKITSEAVNAFMQGRSFKKGNMQVYKFLNVTVMALHGNEIAYRYNDPERTLSICARGWLTNTTKERLNALPGVNIYQRNWQWYLNGVQWDGNLIDIK
jgi:hypothetical protein